MAFQNIANSCAKVVSGDAAEELQLGLEPIKVDIPKINISPTEIKIEQIVLSQVAAAAEALGLSIVRDTATSALALLNTISKAAYKTPLEPLTVDPGDYAETIRAILQEVEKRACKMEKQLQQQEEENPIEISDDDYVGDSEGAGVSGVSISRLSIAAKKFDVLHGEVLGDGVEESDVRDGLVAGASGAASVVTPRAEKSDVVREKVLGASGGTDGVEESEVGDGLVAGASCAASVVTPAADKSDVVCGEVSGASGGNDGVQESDVGDGKVVGASEGCDASGSRVCVAGAADKSAASGANASGEANKGDDESDDFTQYLGNSHNKRRHCPFCNFVGVYLARHLASARPDRAESASERERLVYQADEKIRQKMGQKSTLTNTEERLYQCGLPNCNAIVSRMSQHLQRAHKLTKPGSCLWQKDLSSGSPRGGQLSKVLNPPKNRTGVKNLRQSSS